jgi:hypothetical protein
MALALTAMYWIFQLIVSKYCYRRFGFEDHVLDI